MSQEHRKTIGEFIVAWSNEDGQAPEYHIFHGHTDENNSNLYRYCVPQEDGQFKCRECQKLAPAGVVYFGKTRRLSEDDS